MVLGSFLSAKSRTIISLLPKHLKQMTGSLSLYCSALSSRTRFVWHEFLQDASAKYLACNKKLLRLHLIPGTVIEQDAIWFSCSIEFSLFKKPKAQMAKTEPTPNLEDVCALGQTAVATIMYAAARLAQYACFYLKRFFSSSFHIKNLPWFLS